MDTISIHIPSDLLPLDSIAGFSYSSQFQAPIPIIELEPYYFQDSIPVSIPIPIALFDPVPMIGYKLISN